MASAAAAAVDLHSKPAAAGFEEGSTQSSGKEDQVRVYNDEATPAVFSEKSSYCKLGFSDDDEDPHFIHRMRVQAEAKSSIEDEVRRSMKI